MINWPRLLRIGTRTRWAGTVGMEDRVVRAPNRLHEEIDGQILLLGMRSGDYYRLNKVGSAVWRLLEREVRVGELCETLATLFGVAPEILQRDVTAFLEKLLDQELILIEPAGADPALANP